MSNDLDDLIAAELRQRHLLIDARRAFITRSLEYPTELETLDALAAILHSFYSGIEGVLVHIARKEGAYKRMQAIDS